MKDNNYLNFLIWMMLLPVCLGCIEDGKRGCIEDGDFKAFEKSVDEFSAISSQAECYQLQQSARMLLSKTQNCSDLWEIEATATPWLAIDCSLWKGIDDY